MPRNKSSKIIPQQIISSNKIPLSAKILEKIRDSRNSTKKYATREYSQKILRSAKNSISL